MVGEFMSTPPLVMMACSPLLVKASSLEHVQKQLLGIPSYFPPDFRSFLACQLWARPLLAPFSREFSHELAMGLASSQTPLGRLVDFSEKLQENHMKIYETMVFPGEV